MLGDVNVRQVFVRNKCSMFFFCFIRFHRRAANEWTERVYVADTCIPIRAR